MIIRQEDKDIIKIDLEELFGKISYLTAHDAEKTIPETNPILLVMNQGDQPLFLTYVDIVLSDISALFVSHIPDNGITVTQTEITFELVKDSITQLGLDIVDKAIARAFASGILAKYQQGAPGYEYVQQHNANEYEGAKYMISNTLTYRRTLPNRLKITQRIY